MHVSPLKIPPNLQSLLVKAIQIKCSELNFDAVRRFGLLLFMSITGLRAKEIVGDKFSDLLKGPSDETLLKYRKKGGKIGFAVLPKDLVEIIKDYHSKFLIKSYV